MKFNKVYVFIRNDDVRDTLDDSLIAITNICIKYKVPIIHAVEPANVSKVVIDWLLKKKLKNPELIEIIQHGYDHNVRKLHPNGVEFGGKRDLNSQYNDIKKGAEFMDFYFGENWSRIMAFPYGNYNKASIEALQSLEFKAINSSISFALLSRIKDYFGQLLKKNILLGKRISYHTKKRPKSNVLDIGISVNIIKKYLSEENCIHFSKKEIVHNIYKNAKYTNVIGILFHHRFHENEIQLIEEIISKLVESNLFKFVKLNDLV